MPTSDKRYPLKLYWEINSSGICLDPSHPDKVDDSEMQEMVDPFCGYYDNQYGLDVDRSRIDEKDLEGYNFGPDDDET